MTWIRFNMPIVFILSLSFFQKSQSQSISHVYRFANSLKPFESCGPDILLAKTANCPASDKGGAFVNDRIGKCGIQRSVFANSMNWGFCYPNPRGIIKDEYTIHIYLKIKDWGTRPWARIIDFSNGDHDKGIYFKKVSDEEQRCLDFYPNGIVGPCSYFKTDLYYLLSFTRNKATKVIDVYVNGELFVSYYDADDMYCSAGGPIYIFRDDKAVPCESGQAYFSYLSFSNSFSDESMIQYVNNSICKLTELRALELTVSNTKANTDEKIIVAYSGNVSRFDNQYLFHWDWDNASVSPGERSGLYSISWKNSGVKKITLTMESKTCDWKKSITKTIVVSSPQVVTVVQPSIEKKVDSAKLADSHNENDTKTKDESSIEKDVTIIYVDSGKTRLSFYDNAEIDGDSISVFINHTPVLVSKRLSDRAIDYDVNISKSAQPVLIEIVAENEGSISPNTCLLIIKSDKIYVPVFLSSTISKGKKIKLEYLGNVSGSERAK